jgi:ribonuclease BN (tRNA processing enzyme)
VLLAVLLTAASSACAETSTRLVLLGTGTPQPDPDRSGAATAIVVNGKAYLVDFGPGVVRRAAAAKLDKGITELDPANITTAFLTHLHSDHTAGYPDLILTPWTMGRDKPLEVYGPDGLRKMTELILSAYGEDITIRRDGFEKGSAEGIKVITHEIKPGVVFKDVSAIVLTQRTGALSYREIPLPLKRP